MRSPGMAPSVIARSRATVRFCQGFATGCRSVGGALPMVFDMNDRLRTRLAAGGTIAALGVLATVALAASSSAPAEQAASKPTVPPPVQVRTVVERRTVHVRRKARVRHAPAAASAAPATAATPATAPVPTSAPAPAPVVRVAQRRAEVEHEVKREGGDDLAGRGGED